MLSFFKRKKISQVVNEQVSKTFFIDLKKMVKERLPEELWKSIDPNDHEAWAMKAMQAYLQAAMTDAHRRGRSVRDPQDLVLVATLITIVLDEMLRLSHGVIDPKIMKANYRNMVQAPVEYVLGSDATGDVLHAICDQGSKDAIDLTNSRDGASIVGAIAREFQDFVAGGHLGYTKALGTLLIQLDGIEP